MQSADSNWRKSSASQNDDCVECRPDQDSFLVRDSKNSTGPHLKVSSDGWVAFLASVTRH